MLSKLPKFKPTHKFKNGDEVMQISEYEFVDEFGIRLGIGRVESQIVINQPTGYNTLSYPAQQKRPCSLLPNKRGQFLKE